MQQIKISELKLHPRNQDFFDDMSGEKWQEFLESVKTSGIIEPIVITEDMTIVSGHQRVRACKELYIEDIIGEIKHYDSDDDILKDLLEANIRQRGNVGGSAKKVGLRIKELERLYCVQYGNNQHSMTPNYSESTTQEELAKKYEMSVDTWQNYKLLTKMIPELEELLDTGIVTKTTTLAIIKQLSPDEQEQFVSSLDITKKITKREVQCYINEINLIKQDVATNSNLETDIKNLEKQVSDNDTDIQKLKNRISVLLQQGTKIETITKEVDRPETVNKLKDLQEKLAEKTAQNSELSKKLIRDSGLLATAMGTSTNYQLVSHCSEITLKMLNFIKEMSPYDYMAESFNEIPTATRIEYEKCISSVKKWADRILETINKSEDIIDM